MTSNHGSQDVMISDPNVIETVKETAQPGRAKLLIDPDGTVRLEANSNFPIPGILDKQKLFAACTDDGHTNVYYSPSGNPSEVYLLKPTAKSAGKQLKLTTRESINTKASTVKDQSNEPDQDKTNPIVMSMTGQDTVAHKLSSLPSKSLSQGIPSTTIISPPPCATPTSSSSLDSPVDDSDFPIDLPVSFESDVKDSGVNFEIDELDSLLPDIGSTIAAHLQNKDSQQNTVAQKENLVKSLLTQKTPVVMHNTSTPNNVSVKVPISHKNISTKPVPVKNSNGQLLLITSGTGQNQCIFLSETENLANITKSLPTMVTNSSVQPMGNAFSLLQPSHIPPRTTAPFKPLNTVSLLQGAVHQKTVPRILNVSNNLQTKSFPSGKQTSVPIIVMPTSTPATSSYTPTNIAQKHVPVKVVPIATQAIENKNVMQVNSGNVSGLKFVSSNTTGNIKQFLTQKNELTNTNFVSNNTTGNIKQALENTNVTQMYPGNVSGLKFVSSNTAGNIKRLTQKTSPESTNTTIGNTTASQCLKQVVAKANGSTPFETEKMYPRVPSEDLVECKNINNNNNSDDDYINAPEDTPCNIRIDSVFSLSEPSQSEENAKKDGKRKRKNANKDKKFKFVSEVKECKCKPMYVVLERLAISKNTVNIHDDTLSKTKCTDYCRKRTLNCLCGIDLLDCKNPALSLTAKYMQRRRIEITPPSPSKVARQLGDSDVKSRCVDDWTLVKEVPKEAISTARNTVHKPSIQNMDHSSYASRSETSRLGNSKCGNKPNVAHKTINSIPTMGKISNSQVLSTQQAFEGALKNAVASKNVLNSTTVTNPLIQKMPSLIKIPLTVSLPKPSNPTINTGTVASTITTTIPSSMSKVSPTMTKEKVLNGNFYLVTIDGKMVLIPTDKAVNNKAFVLQQAADGTTGLIPACLSYSKTTPTVPINTTTSTPVTSVNSSKAVMTIRSIAPSTTTTMSLASNSNTSWNILPAGPRLPKTIQPPIPSVTPANVSIPQAVSMVPNARLATPDTKNKSPILQAAFACASKTDTPSPTIDQTKKRKKTLSERYPLPPGVIIKQEPRTTGYGDEPKDQATPLPLPVTSNRRLVQSVLTPSVVQRHASPSPSPTLSNTTVNSRSLLRNQTPIQSIGGFNTSISAPATNIRTLNVSQANKLSTNPRPPISIIQYLPVSQNAPRHVNPPFMKNNTITFTKLPTNSNAFKTNVQNSSIPSKTQVNAAERHVPVLIPRVPSVDNKIIENNSPPDSPGPPDLGEPQIILPSKKGQQASDESDTNSDTGGASCSFPVFTSPVLEREHKDLKAKTPQELRIEKLKEQLREQEKALEEMRKKRGLECRIDIDDE